MMSGPYDPQELRGCISESEKRKYGIKISQGDSIIITSSGIKLSVEKVGNL